MMLLGRKESNYWLLTQLVSKTGEKRKVVQLYCTAVWPFHYFLHFYSHQLAMLLSLLLRHEHSELDCFSHLYTQEVQAEVN